MTHLTLAASLVAVALCCGGCTTADSDSTASTSNAANTMYDGQYLPRLIVKSGNQCGSGFSMPVTVAGGKLTAQYSRSRGIFPQGVVQADGTFKAQDSTTTFVGRIAGGKIVADSGGSRPLIPE